MATMEIRFDDLCADGDVALAADVVDLDGIVHWSGVLVSGAARNADGFPAGRAYVVRAYVPLGGILMSEVTVNHDDETVRVALPAPDSPSPRMFDTPDEMHAVQLWTRPFSVLERTGWRTSRVPLVTGSYRDCDVLVERYPHGLVASLRIHPRTERPAEIWLSAGARSFAVSPGLAETETTLVVQDDGVMVRPRVASPYADVLLSYLHTGDVRSARIVGAFLEEELRRRATEHRSVPEPAFAAESIALGYYWIRAGPSERFRPYEVQDLDGRLYRTFCAWPTYPDGAIIYGWHAMRAERPTKAAQCFVEACQRGLPVYTLGIRCLFDGLRALANGETALADALAWLTPLAAAADRMQRTTTLARTFGEPPFEEFERDSPAQPAWDVRVHSRLANLLTARGIGFAATALEAALETIRYDPFSFAHGEYGLRTAPVELGREGEERYTARFVVDENVRSVVLMDLVRHAVDAPRRYRVMVAPGLASQVIDQRHSSASRDALSKAVGQLETEPFTVEGKPSALRSMTVAIDRAQWDVSFVLAGNTVTILALEPQRSAPP
jgi:hypothetical protein